MSVMANSIPSPPQSVALSFSFAFAYSSPEVSSPLQPVVRKTIERFSDMTQLINVIVALKNQSQARNLFTPDPPRPLAVIDDEEAQIATWLVDLAKFYHTASSSETDSQSGNSQALVPQTKVSESSRSFLVASHAVLALHQILPYATASSNAYGSPLPLPTVESLRTALTALHLVARSIQVSSPGSRTRTQAILLDAMPRILSLLDILTSSSLSSLDHFVLVTSQRNTVHQLLDDLNRAIACMSSPSARTPSLDSCGQALEKSSKGLRTVVDIGMEVHQSQQPGHNLITSMAPESTATYSALSAKLHPLAAPDTPSTPSSSADGLPWTGPSSSYTAFPNVSNGQDSLQRRPYLYHSETLQANPSFFSSSLGNSQFLTSESFSMSSHLANSPLLRSYDRTTLASPSYVGSLHAFL